MSVADASDSNSDREDETLVIVGELAPGEIYQAPPRTLPTTSAEDIDQLLERFNRESEEREERFRQQQTTADGERHALLERLQRMEQGYQTQHSQQYDQNAFDSLAIDPSYMQSHTPVRTTSGRSSRASRAGPPVPSPILPPNNPDRRTPNRAAQAEPRVNFGDVYERSQQMPRALQRRPISNVTQVTTPSLFVVPKPIAHLTVPSMMQLGRLYERHMVRPGNSGLIIYLYSTEYFTMGVLDYIENVLNTYYGSSVAAMVPGDSGERAPNREDLETMEPAELF